MNRQWWVRSAGGEVSGPMTAAEVRDAVLTGRISESAEVSYDRVLWARTAVHPDLLVELAPSSRPLIHQTVAPTMVSAPPAPPAYAPMYGPPSAGPPATTPRSGCGAMLFLGLVGATVAAIVIAYSQGRHEPVALEVPAPVPVARRSESTVPNGDVRRPESAAATTVADAGPNPFHQYVSARDPRASADITVAYVNVRGTHCPRRLLRDVGLMLDSPTTLRAALQTQVQFLTCYPESSDYAEPVTTRWPLPGVVIPDGVDWERRYVVTPTRQPHLPPPVWCTGGERDGFPNAVCSRSLEGCAREMRRLNEGGADYGWHVSTCRVTERLWCFDTGGTEIQCGLTEDTCEAINDTVRRRGTDCETRWAL